MYRHDNRYCLNKPKNLGMLNIIGSVNSQAKEKEPKVSVRAGSKITLVS